jgi:hypothetical protein
MSETLLGSYETTWRAIPKDSHLQQWKYIWSLADISIDI